MPDPTAIHLPDAERLERLLAGVIAMDPTVPILDTFKTVPGVRLFLALLNRAEDARIDSQVGYGQRWERYHACRDAAKELATQIVAGYRIIEEAEQAARPWLDGRPTREGTV